MPMYITSISDITELLKASAFLIFALSFFILAIRMKPKHLKILLKLFKDKAK